MVDPINKLIAEFERVAKKIDKHSGSPKFSAHEHDKIVKIIEAAKIFINV